MVIRLMVNFNHTYVVLLMVNSNHGDSAHGEFQSYVVLLMVDSFHGCVIS
jgi:hypothetical protein